MKRLLIVPVLVMLAVTAVFAALKQTGELYRKSVRQFAAGNFREAETGFRKVIRSVSKDSDSALYAKSSIYLGDIRFYGGDSQSAIILYGNAMDVVRKGKIANAARYRTGRALVYSRKYARGITELREFLVRKKASEPMEDYALYWIARAYQGKGQKENALKTLDILTNLNPKTRLKNVVLRYRAELMNWDQKEEYRNDLKRIFSGEEKEGALEKGAFDDEKTMLKEMSEAKTAREGEWLDNSRSDLQMTNSDLGSETEGVESSEETVTVSSVSSMTCSQSSSSSSKRTATVSPSVNSVQVRSSSSAISSTGSKTAGKNSSSVRSVPALSSASSRSAGSSSSTAPETSLQQPVSNTVKMNFILTQDYLIQKGVLLPFFDDRLLGDFEDMRKESTYRMKDFLGSGMQEDMLPQMPEDVYLKNKQKTLSFNAKGKGVLRLIQYKNLRMFQTTKNLQEDIAAILELIRKDQLPKWKENRPYPSAFDPVYSVGLMFEDPVDTDAVTNVSYRLKPAGLMIGAMGVVWLEKDESK